MLSNNGSVTFNDNTSFSGGAIYGDSGSTIMLNNNGSVTFSDNKASLYGGAIYGTGDILLCNNDSVTFSGSSISGSTSAYGGAIYGDSGSTIMLNNNGSVTFSDNKASLGGAIYGTGDILLCYNDSVTFSGNAVSGSTSAYGGAICVRSENAITLDNNGSVTFSGNSSSYEGGAIHTNGSLHICNNDSVLFEKNVVKSSSSYFLYSIRAGSNYTAISFSGAAGKSIEFRDSVYIGMNSFFDLNWNYTYLDADGKSITVKQEGDIIFTGAYTEAHLNEILAGDGLNRTASEQEILNSCTTVVYTMTNLHGGRLRVEDGAIYKGYGITAMEGSVATVMVKDATLSHDGHALTFNAGTTLQVEGESLIVGDVLMMAQSVLHLEGETTINGALTLGLGMQLAGNILAEVQKLQLGESLTLVSGLESLAVQTQNLMRSVEYTTVMDGYEVRASEYFSNLAGNAGLVMRYDSEAGTVCITQTMVVPEPATTTLGLLSLAAFAVRRRRK